MNKHYNILIERGWVIGACNHYFIFNKEAGTSERHLFVIMTKGIHFIKIEGANEDILWERLVNLADKTERADERIEVNNPTVNLVKKGKESTMDFEVLNLFKKIIDVLWRIICTEASNNKNALAKDLRQEIIEFVGKKTLGIQK